MSDEMTAHTVFLVECRTLLEETSETGLEVESDIAMVASSLLKAEAFIRMNPNWGDGENEWCWSVHEAQVDDFDPGAVDMEFYSKDGRPCLTQRDALNVARRASGEDDDV